MCWRLENIDEITLTQQNLRFVLILSKDTASKKELSGQIASSIMLAVGNISTFEALVYESNHTLKCSPVKVSYACQDMNEVLRINSTMSGFTSNQKCVTSSDHSISVKSTTSSPFFH